MQLSRSQVIALFLTSTQAANFDVSITEIVNSNCSFSTVNEGANASAMTPCSSMTPCTLNQDCSGGEKCAAFVEMYNNQPQLSCMYPEACKNLGKRNGTAFTIECTDLGGKPEFLPNPNTLLTAVENIITVDGEGTWKDVLNLKVSSKFNFQDGWWIRNDNEATIGIYTENDKPKIEKCTDQSGCDKGECCAYWPDANNKRCIDSSFHSVEQIINPLDAFTPVCIGGQPIQSDPVDNTGDLLQNAIDAVTNYDNIADGTIKERAGYVDMTNEEKLAFDLKQSDKVVARVTRDNADKTAAGYFEMNTDAKIIYQTLLLKHKKETFEACSENDKQITCIDSVQLRNKEEQKRKEDGYYQKNEEERNTFDTQIDQILNEEKIILSVAWKEANKIAKGQPGSECSKGIKCQDKSHCCGTATPKAAGREPIDGICVDKVTHQYTDGLGLYYTHVCGAQKLLAAAGTYLLATQFM